MANSFLYLSKRDAGDRVIYICVTVRKIECGLDARFQIVVLGCRYLIRAPLLKKLLMIEAVAAYSLWAICDCHYGLLSAFECASQCVR